MTNALNTDPRRRLASDLEALPEPVLVLPAPDVRRLVKQRFRIVGLGLSVPHTHGLVVPRAALARLRAAVELELPPGPPDAPVTVLAEPEPDELEGLSRDARRRWLWQRLFELRVEGAVDARGASGALRKPALRARIQRIGHTEYDEIRAVIREQDRWLPAGRGRPRDAASYAAFAGAFLALYRFEPERLAGWFPSLQGREAEIAELLAADVDVERLLEETCPSGAPKLDWAEAARAPGPEPDGDEEPESEAAARGDGETHGSERTTELAARLAALTDPDGPSEAEWRAALAPLEVHLGVGFARSEARFLYDLRRACLARERPAARVDLVGWALSAGRRPVRRPLPLDPWLAPCRHLQTAHKRLPRLRLTPAARRRLADTLRQARHQAEADFRQRFEQAVLPRLAPGMGGDSTVEARARHRLVVELADRALLRGFVSFAELRDAVARGDARLEEVRGLGAYLRGDALLRTNRALVEPTEGVYRPAEIYLRGLQRVSAPLFGTRVGRVVTRGLLLPAAGAYVILEGVQHLVGPLVHYTAGLRVHLTVPAAVVGLALALAVLINVPVARRAVAGAARWLFGGLWRGIGAAVRAVARVARWIPPLARLLDSRFVARLADHAGRVWRRLRYRLLPSLLRAILDFFEGLVMGLERALYTVDQWLRFRPGQARIGVALKAPVGLVWSVVSYVVRFYVTLLIEPQVNPVKHFPVVTVSHKIILPMSITITEVVSTALAPLGPVLANSIAVSTVFLLPGVFGFLAWELKANWKLYRANRPKCLSAAVVGAHGETVPRLLRPGFHSGTLPKLFARRRRSARRDARRGDDRAQRKLAEAHHHLEEALTRFVQRDLLALSRTVDTGAGSTPAVVLQGIRLSSNRIALRLERAGGRDRKDPPAPAYAVLTLDEHAGWLVGGLRDEGLLQELPSPARDALLAAVAGFLARAAVELVRERIAAALPPGATYDVVAEGLVVWPEAEDNVEAIYPLHRGARVTPRMEPPQAQALPALSLDRLRAPPIPWTVWQRAWEPDGAEERAALAAAWHPSDASRS